MRNISRLTLEEKIGQMMLVDFSGFNLEDRVIDHISKYKIGGVILFKKNLKEFNQTKKLIADLQNLSLENTGAPMFISVDQEGGSICPLVFSRANHPGNMCLGVINDEEFVKKTARYTAEELSRLGFNITYAPVCDIQTNPLNPIVGVRSFGQDKNKVARFCAAAVKSLQSNGICACGKHFPGHGDTSFDSHLSLSVVSHSLDHIEKVDLLPFEAAIKAGVRMIMTTHILFADLDKKYPATLSKNILTGLLRKKMGFKGLIITDSFQMKAIKDNYGFDKAAVLAVKAGADIVMALGAFEEQAASYNGLLKAVNRGEISEKRIDESVKRIFELKAKQANEKKTPQLNPVKAKKLYYEIAKKSVTLVKNDNNLLPINFSKHKTGFVYPDKDILGYDFTKYLPKSKNIIKLGYNNESVTEKQEEYFDFAKKCDILVIVTCKRARLDEVYKNLFNELNNINAKTVIASIYNSYHALDFDNLGAHLLTYSFTPEAVDVLIKTIFGKHKPAGHLPHDLPGVAKMGWGMSY